MSEEVKVVRWSSKTAPQESRLQQILAEENLSPYRWSNRPGDLYGAHSHDFHKIIYVVSGSITFRLPDRGEQLDLDAGDRMELPAGIRHEAEVGTQGVVCLEAHRPAG